MDDIANGQSGKVFSIEQPEWYNTIQPRNNHAGRSKLSNLFERLEYYSREGKRIRNESRQVTPRLTAPDKCRTAMRKFRTFRVDPDEESWIMTQPASEKKQMLILAPVEFDYSQSLHKTREKSKELLQIDHLTRKLESNKNRRLRNLSQGSKKTKQQPSRPTSRGLDQLCVQTIKGILFPSVKQRSPLTKTKKKEFEETIVRRLNLLKSCYNHIKQ